MLLDPMKTVREVAVAMPNALRIFEKTKIDYCCGGDQLLGAACAKAGVNIQTLEQMLETSPEPATGSAINFQKLSVTELITHILDKHHSYTKEEMQRLEKLSAKVVGVHGANHPELLTCHDLLNQLFDDLGPHMRKEEQILFPYMVELERSAQQKRSRPFAPFGTVNNPIRMMMMEHDTAGDILRALRHVSADYKVPADACISYQTLYQAVEAFEQDLHQHIHLENNILFPKAVALEESV